MSEITRQEVLARKRDRYARAGREHKSKILDEVAEFFGYHRKAAIRALRPRTVLGAPFVRGRPKEYAPDQLPPPLKAIWLAALQPCGTRLKACLPDWLPAYGEDHRRLAPDVRQPLLSASRATLGRLLIQARVAHRRRAATRPGSLLRAEIPIRTERTENAPGLLELDTVALCGGALAGRVLPGLPSVTALCADAGYRGTFVEHLQTRWQKAVHISTKIKDGFAVTPKRWVAERSFGWFNGQRRLREDHEKKTAHAKAMLLIAAFTRTLRALAF